MVYSKKNILTILISVVHLCTTSTMYKSRSLSTFNKKNVVSIFHQPFKNSITTAQKLTQNQQPHPSLKDYIFSLKNTNVLEKQTLSLATKNNQETNIVTLPGTSQKIISKAELNAITNELVSKIMKEIPLDHVIDRIRTYLESPLLIEALPDELLLEIIKHVLPKDFKYKFKKIPNKKVCLLLLSATLNIAERCKQSSYPADTVGFIYYTWATLTEKEPKTPSIILYVHALEIAKSIFLDLPKIADYGSPTITSGQYHALKIAEENKNTLIQYYKHVSPPQKKDILDLTLLPTYRLHLSFKETVSKFWLLSKNINGWVILLKELKNSSSRPVLIYKMLSIMCMINFDNPLGQLSLTRVLIALYLSCLHALMEGVEHRSVTPWNVRLILSST